MDGTFSVASRLFYQLYTLHICFRGFFLPLIYALLPDKTKDTYYDMFSIIKRKMANLDLQFNPTTMMSDFEIGMISTLRLHFPNTELKGCNFHFSQAIWRQTQQLGLTVSYHENSNIRRIIRSLMTLPYIPRNWVRHQYRTIMGMTDADTDSVERLLQYFCSTWLDGQFPLQLWNVFGDEVRTNNRVEGWHHSFNQTVGKSHPNLFEFITALKTEQAATELTKRTAMQGAQPPATKKKYRERAAAIRTLQEEFTSGIRTLDEYFSAVPRHVGYKKM